MDPDHESMKRAAAEAAVEMVEDGMIVGIGTGSTAAYAITALGEAVEAGLEITGVPTSDAARYRAKTAGITISDLDMVDGIDLAIDGADQACEGTLIKGGGGAHTRERIVDAAADQFIAIVDERKVVDQLDAPIPLEVLPAARHLVQAAVDDLGGTATVRTSGSTDGPAYTERGMLLIDADMGMIEDASAVAKELDTLPGVIDHGLFIGLADSLLVGTPDGVEREW